MKTIYLHIRAFDFDKKWNHYKGISFKIDYEPGSGVFRVAHTFCGRNEKAFSKKFARQALATKDVTMLTLKELPGYLSETSRQINKQGYPAMGLTSAIKYCWRFV